jgi:enoyl-CoA hydratase/carnithine racemase
MNQARTASEAAVPPHDGETGRVLVQDEAGIRIVRLDRPQKKNALTLAMYAQMERALREADQSDAVRCVVIAGTPGVFTAGNDIADFMKAASGGGDWDRAAMRFLDALARCRKPMVAAVGGLAVGIGTTMLLHCDHVVMARDASLSTPFLKLALVPEAASTLLAPLRMGHARAFSLLAMGRPLSAAEAKEAGLVNTVVDAADVEAAALDAAREIAALPPRALAIARALMRGPIEAVIGRMEEEATHYQDLLRSDEARAAFQAFLARRK